MNIIQKLTIQKLALDRFNFQITTKGLTKTQYVIVKIDRKYFFTKRLSEFIYLVELTFLPQKDIEHHIKVLVYDSNIDQIIDARQEFIDLYEIQSIKFLDDKDLMRMSNLNDRGWVGFLEVNTISGPFQFDKRVQKIDIKQPVTFHAFVNHPDAHKVQLVSMRWLMQLPTGKIIDIRNLKGFSLVPKQGYVVVSFYLSEPTSFQLIVSFTHFRKTYFEYKHFIPSQNPKTKVHFTIGMFFDGTGNNRFNSESVYYKNLDKNNMVNEKALKEKLKLTGTKSTFEVATDSSYWNPFSNVALLFDLYETNNEKRDDFNIDVTLKQYVQGIGTIEGENDNMPGFAFGEGPHGIIGKVWEGCFKLSEEIKKNLGVNMEIGSLTFDVFGFSRGAASARHFCNEILGKQSIEDITESIFSENPSDRSTKNDNIQPPKTSKIMKPIGRKYKLGLLGRALQLQKTQHEVKYYEKPMNSQAKNNADLLKDIEKHRIDFENNAPVKIRFVGLFDTVVAQMIIKNHFGKKLDALNMIAPTPIPPFIGSLLELKLDKVRQKIDHLPIKQIVHLIAEDEYRENFASTKVGNAKHIFERRLPGAHSDLGGGYAAMKIDEDIVDYDYITHQTPELPNPKRLLDLKQFLINKGYCLSGEIEIKAIKTFNYTTRNAVAFQTLFQLIVTRSLTPRFSIVYLNVMREIAKNKNVPLTASIFDTPHPFEFNTPEGLIEYERELIENLKSQFEGKSNKPVKKDLPKNLYVHLSSNFNKSKGIERYGAAITGNKDIDTLFYVNAPRYSNPKQDSYERETYTHPQ